MATVLIVDAMTPFTQTIDAALRGRGYGTRLARNGREALEALAAERPDVVLLDLGTHGGVEGLAVLRSMRTSPAQRPIPVIVLSADCDRRKVIAAGKLGARGYLLKSAFSLQRLLAEVAAAAAGCAPLKDGEAREAGEPAGPSGIATLEPVADRSEVLNAVASAMDIKGFSPAAAQVLNLTEDPHCSVGTIARAIAQDPAVVLKVIRLANSPAYAAGTPVDSVHTAVVRIGVDRIRQTVLGIAIMDRFGTGTIGGTISTRRFWEHSIACGLIASELAGAGDGAGGGVVFTAGLLHDVGRALLAELLASRYALVLEAASRLHVPLETAEVRMLGITHAEIMEVFLQRWNLPKHLRAPIVMHHNSPERLALLVGAQAVSAQRLALANRLAHVYGLGSSGNDTIYPTEELASALGIEGDAIRAIAGRVQARIAETLAALLPAAEAPRGAPDVLGLPSGSFRPLYVGVRPGIDAVRLFVDRIAGPVAGAPTVVVARARSAEERAAVGALLAEARRESRVRDLPVLLVAPPNLELDPASLSGARCLKLGMPFTVARFAEAVRGALGTDSSRAAA